MTRHGTPDDDPERPEPLVRVLLTALAAIIAWLLLYLPFAVLAW